MNLATIQFYSGFGAGYRIGDQDWNKANSYPYDRVAVQVNLIGLRVGKKLGGFLEIGSGYKGMFNFVLSYQF